MHLLDYGTLRVIWWLLLGVLLAGFAVMDGFDLGVGILLPAVARSDSQRRVVLNTVGPVWEGNQVWLILGGGAIFAAWPLIYAAAFSGFYLAMLLVLFALILRPVGFKYRSKMPSPAWRATWDWLLFVGGFVPALVFGVAVGNALEGVPFRFDETLRMTYAGSFFGLLNPFAVLSGLISLAMLTMHGAAYLCVKTEGDIATRARRLGGWAALAAAVLFGLAGLWIAFGIDGYRIAGPVAHDAASNPLGKSVAREVGAWLGNYRAYPWMVVAPILGGAGALLAGMLLRMRAAVASFIASALSVIGIVATAGLSMFPFILPSSIDGPSSLTVWDASSSRATLVTMLIVTVLLLPVVLAYTGFVYRVMRGKVTSHQVELDHMSY